MNWMSDERRRLVQHDRQPGEHPSKRRNESIKALQPQQNWHPSALPRQEDVSECPVIIEVVKFVRAATGNADHTETLHIPSTAQQH